MRVAAFIFLISLTVAEIQHCSGETIMKLYSVNDGLPSSTVYAILQSRDGFLWFATNAGVSRYDGKNFVNFNTSQGLSDNEILSLGEDSKGRIWFLGFSGRLSYYLNGKIYNSTSDSTLARAQSINACMEFFEAANGDIWIVTLMDYIRISGSTVTKFHCNQIRISALGVVMNGSRKGSVCINSPFFSDYKCHVTHTINADNSVESTCVKYNILRGSRFFYLTGDSVLFRAPEGIVLQKDTMQKLVLPIPTHSYYYSNHGILLSRNNKLWISTANDGLFIYDYQNLNKAPERLLVGKSAGKIIEDFENNIWVIAAEGVYMIPSWSTGIKYYNEAAGLPANKVYSVAKSNNKIYAGFIKGQVGMVTSGEVGSIPFLDFAVDICRVTKITSKGEDILIGSDHATIHVNEKSKCKHDYLWESELLNKVNSVKDIYLTTDKAYIATSTVILSVGISPPGCLERAKLINKDTGIRHYCVFAEPGGRVWCGNKFGLHSYEEGKETNHSGEHPILEKRIEDIEQMSDSTFVLATYGYGLVFYKNGQVLMNITEADGLGDNICRRLCVFNDNIYVATSKGVTRLLYRNGKIVNMHKYTTANALPSNDVNDVYVDKEGIYIATSEGLVALEHSNVIEKELIPMLHITGVEVNNISYSPDSTFSFSHTHNSFVFDFVGISYQSANEVVYQYRISDEEEWIETKNNSLNFPQLSPGKYKFQVKARIAGMPWSDTKSFSFTVKPPFWETWWFISGIILVLSVLLLRIINLRKRKTEKKAADQLKIKGQIAHLEQQALQAMMNPHFIFNVMNTIQHYINNDHRHKANIFLSDFARLIRMNLDLSARSSISLHDEMEYLKLYLSIESMRFEKKFTYQIEIAPGIDDEEIMIPVMIMQPFVENAVLHGIMPMTEPGCLQIGISKLTDELLKVQIIDNGIGIKQSYSSKADKGKHVSRGMGLTQKRIDLMSRMTGSDLHIRIQDRMTIDNTRGTVVEITLPCNLTE